MLFQSKWHMCKCSNKELSVLFLTASRLYAHRFHVPHYESFTAVILREKQEEETFELLRGNCLKVNGGNLYHTKFVLTSMKEITMISVINTICL